jgi:DNA-binding MarR family transcriptional regulator
MQIRSKPDVASLFNQLLSAEVPAGRGLAAWGSLLRAHATLLRLLDLDLYQQTGLHLAEFDILAQLALAGGKLRMTELSSRALSSRSGMTRRVDNLVGEGLLRRTGDQTDGRGVVVALTGAGVARLREITPVHMRGVTRLFVSQLDDQDLACLERALNKVIRDCSFG